MKVVHISENSADGAGRAAFQLHSSFLKRGINSLFITRDENQPDSKIVSIEKSNSLITRIVWKGLRSLYSPKSMFNFNYSAFLSKKITENCKGADAIILHSTQLILSAKQIVELQEKTNALIIWSVLDIEPITGGCHFNDGCLKFHSECNECPMLESSPLGDRSLQNWKEKLNLNKLPLVFVHATSEMQKEGLSSGLYSKMTHLRILLSVDQNVFTPIDKVESRKFHKVDKDKKVITFGAFKLDDPRKGGAQLKRALEIISEKKLMEEELVLLTIGDLGNFNIEIPGIRWTHLGKLNSNIDLSYFYNLSDLHCVPSIDDVGPMMVNEALSTHTPVIAFKKGVAADLVEPGLTGDLVKAFDENELAEKIVKSLYTDFSQKKTEFQKKSDLLNPETQLDEYLKIIEKFRH